MSVDDLLYLHPGQPVTLNCQTTGADIYFKGPTDADREPFNPSNLLKQPIRYQISGRVVGIEYGIMVTYLVLQDEGEVSIIGMKNGHFKLLSVKTGQKLRHVPIGAIKTIKL